MKPHKIIVSLALVTGCLTLIAASPSARAAAVNTDRFQVSDQRLDADRDDSKKDAKIDRTPPGWDHGNKTGWDNKKMPPGQEKH
jgi:hypothetical protein